MTGIDEPNWGALLPDSDDDNTQWRKLAASEWARLCGAMESAGTLAPENRHQIQRLVVAYVRYDRATAEVFKLGGPVTLAPNGQEMLRQWHVELRQADADATTAEMELGIPPRRRGAVTKAPKKQAAASKAKLYVLDAKKKTNATG